MLQEFQKFTHSVQ